MKGILVFIFILKLNFALAEVSPDRVESMLDQMVRENIISKVEAEKAKLKLKSMNKEEWKKINDKAASIAARSPASALPSNNKVEEVLNIDLEGAQFQQIQDEMKKIIPARN